MPIQRMGRCPELMSEESEEQEIDRWIGVVSAVNAKLIYIPTLAHG